MNGPGPDLTITDLWQQGGQICFQVWNQGDEGSIADFLIGLFVDGANTDLLGMPVALDPDARWTGCFHSAYTCSQPSDQVSITADTTNMVTEGNETNNARLESWNCDGIPPAITDGPTVTDITSNSVTITWQTDEASNSQVNYSMQSAANGMSVYQATYVTNHSITLSDLSPTTLYYFNVESRDPSYNLVRSADLFFKTSALVDLIDPSIWIYPIGTVTETVTTPNPPTTRASPE